MIKLIQILQNATKIITKAQMTFTLIKKQIFLKDSKKPLMTKKAI